MDNLEFNFQNSVNDLILFSQFLSPSSKNPFDLKDEFTREHNFKLPKNQLHPLNITLVDRIKIKSNDVRFCIHVTWYNTHILFVLFSLC